MNYNLQYHPLETMSLAFSVTDNWGFIETHEAQENSSLLSQFHGSLLPALNMSSEIGFSRNRQFLEAREFETWNTQVSLDGDLFQKVGAMISYSYRNTHEIYSGMRIAQKRTSGNFNWRLSQTILITGEADLADDGSIYLNHQYNLSWRFLPKASFAAQTSFSYREGGRGNDRQSYFLNYEFARNGNLYCQYNKNFSRDFNGERTSTAQIGLHTGF